MTLQAEDIRLTRGSNIVLDGLTTRIPQGAFTAIVGPNGCGKSTLLLTLSRILAPSHGQVVLDGKAIARMPARDLARQIGLMPQTSTAPDGMTVAELVACGRFPHQGPLRQWSPKDEQAVRRALNATGLTDLATRHVNELSGGQRQRVWVALVLAQETPHVLLDEPTSFLDITHQMELMILLERLNQHNGQTVVAVLHDLNQACRFATHMIAMRKGRIIAEGRPADVVTRQMVADVYGLDALIISDPVSGTPMIVPRGGSLDTSSPS
ncbi:ABC transporter ATP-binding protein [Ketogulonicigenium vulgare]|nr:ABC transporter ATP-binding protein [Ketogulonicigenium vulgare]ADO44056.1 ABC transporter ATP-binding protein [Ketogulonicigenium vulgare Y25]ALJ82612.1 iron-dicitrate transporter ATP-binding subunit [Ketogulonicigenium vulgare]ANW35365.1 iron-dicitrate transporter ATP-binding subunit [Ketogulonicigenium vulgare]AOZ53282.1 ABC transporter ATP-binding protein [Ketogulonicigenium vulgare]